MSEKIYDVSAEWAKRAWIDDAKYREMYERSVKDPNGFWAEQAKRVDWVKAPHTIENVSFAPGNISIKWFEDGVLNAAYNCIDRHLAKRGNQTAIIWEGYNAGARRYTPSYKKRLKETRMESFYRKYEKVFCYKPSALDLREMERFVTQIGIKENDALLLFFLFQEKNLRRLSDIPAEIEKAGAQVEKTAKARCDAVLQQSINHVAPQPG